MNQEFYELLQTYRHAPLSPQKKVAEAAENIVKHIVAVVAMAPDHGAMDVAEWVGEVLRGEGNE